MADSKYGRSSEFRASEGGRGRGDMSNASSSNHRPTSGGNGGVDDSKRRQDTRERSRSRGRAPKQERRDVDLRGGMRSMDRSHRTQQRSQDRQTTQPPSSSRRHDSPPRRNDNSPRRNPIPRRNASPPRRNTSPSRRHTSPSRRNPSPPSRRNSSPSRRISPWSQRDHSPRPRDKRSSPQHRRSPPRERHTSSPPPRPKIQPVNDRALSPSSLTSDMEIDEEPAVSIRPSDSNEEPTAPTKQPAHAATPSAVVLSESKEDVAQATLASASLPKDQHHPRNRAGEQAPAKHDHCEGLKNPSSRVYTAEELAGLKLMQRSADEHAAKNADRNARKDPQETKHRTPEDGHVNKPWNYPNDVKKGTTVPLEQSQDMKRGDHSKDEWADITRRKPLQRSAEENNVMRKYPKEATNGAMSKDEIETSQGKKRKAESEEGRGGSAKQPTRKKLDKPPRPVYSNPKTEAWAQTWTDVWQKYREANRVETKCLALQGDVDLSLFMVALAESELATVGQRIQAHEARLQQWERDGILDMIVHPSSPTPTPTPDET